MILECRLLNTHVVISACSSIKTTWASIKTLRHYVDLITIVCVYNTFSMPIKQQMNGARRYIGY